MPRVESSSALYGVAGWPLQDTLSPRLHNAAFTALGLAAVYVPLRVPPGRAAGLLGSLETLGFHGANVTVPYKEIVFRQCRRLGPEARASRSVNTLVRTPHGWEGHSTDGEGLVSFLRTAGLPSRAMNVVILGSGGAARSAAEALLRRSGVRLSMVTRSPRQAQASLAGLGRPGRGSSLEILKRGGAPARAAVESARLVLNATTLGTGSRDPLPCPATWVASGATAVDMIYGRETAWQKALRRRGRTAYSGLGMLIHQAALSLELWTGCKALSWMLWTGGWDEERIRSGASPTLPAGDPRPPA